MIEQEMENNNDANRTSRITIQHQQAQLSQANRDKPPWLTANEQLSNALHQLGHHTAQSPFCLSNPNGALISNP